MNTLAKISGNLPKELITQKDVKISEFINQHIKAYLVRSSNKTVLHVNAIQLLQLTLLYPKLAQGLHIEI